MNATLPSSLPTTPPLLRIGVTTLASNPDLGNDATMTTATVSWDPYDVDIARDPYPTYRRLRETTPLYRNDEHDFYALSRFADCNAGLPDWETYRSGRGAVLELIKSGIELPSGTLIFEDPPVHSIHRSLLVRVFTPRRVAALEPKIRAFCAAALDPLA